jgi:predicted SAM-dependent methyltransferase
VAEIGLRLRRSRVLAALLDARLAFQRLPRERQLAARDRRLLSEWTGRDDLRLNIGSSAAHVPGWISIDLGRDPAGVCFQMDAAKPWPFHDGAAAAINSEHFIEHLTREQAAVYVREAFRVLRPGGVIRTSTPDLEGMAAAYAAKDAHVLEVHRSHGYDASNHADLVNNYFLQHGHRHIFDFESLRALLAEAGFEQIERVSFGESRHEELRGIDTHDVGELESLVVAVDAVKPAR